MHRDSHIDFDNGSEIYVVDNYYPSQQGSRPPSNLSSHYKPSSVISTSNKNKAGVKIETMSAPNPFCPHSRGVCCLLLLINLGLILVTLGFSIVLQLFDPPFVWYCGVLFLIIGFIALISSLIFCVSICRENQHHDNQLYWTHHWSKKINI